MKGINRVILVGNLANPESHEKNGFKYFTASLAINSEKTDKETGNKEKITTWVNLVIFSTLAERAALWLRKGDLVYIEGYLSVSNYTDKNNIKRTSTNVVVNRFQKLNSRKDDDKTQANIFEEDSQSSSEKPEVTKKTDDAYDDIPF